MHRRAQPTEDFDSPPVRGGVFCTPKIGDLKPYGDPRLEACCSVSISRMSMNNVIIAGEPFELSLL